MSLFEAGTAWPTSYDDDYGEILQHDDPVIEQITEANEDDAGKLAFYREDCCYHDLPSRLSAHTKEPPE